MISYKTALKVILLFGIAGILFSGYLSFSEISDSDPVGLSCSGGEEGGELFGIPVCIYGFIMYVIITLVAIVGLNSKKEN